MIPVTTFDGLDVAVFGLGGSGLVTARALLAGGARVIGWDDKEASRRAAIDAGIACADLSKADWSRFAALVLAPGVPLTHPKPHWTVDLAKAAGVEVIGDIELFCRERRRHAPDAPFVAITGTNGKSTTTALTAHMLRQLGVDVQMGGNIGVPILALDAPTTKRAYVIEVSSYQIDLAPSLDPTVGVLLNVTPDHIDRHGTFEHYTDVKSRLVTAARVAVIGVDDGPCKQIIERHQKAGSELDLVTVDRNDRDGFDVAQGIISFGKTNTRQALLDINGIGTLRGRHNWQNAAVAVAAVCRVIGKDAVHDRALLSLIQQALRSFPGLPHRMEEVGRAGKVLFINDSKATNADSTEKALLSFPNDIYWIAGGLAKDGGIESLAPLFGRIARAYLIGEAAENFAKTVEGKVPYVLSGSLDAALAAAARDARASRSINPVVLLSPACASFDQFKNFEDRGNVFRELVSELNGVETQGGQVGGGDG